MEDKGKAAPGVVGRKHKTEYFGIPVIVEVNGKEIPREGELPPAPGDVGLAKDMAMSVRNGDRTVDELRTCGCDHCIGALELLGLPKGADE